MDVFDLVATITLDSSGYDKGLTKAQSKTSSAGNKIKTALSAAAGAGTALTGAVVAGGAAIVSMATKASDTADHIDKMSQKIGVSRTAYQELDFALSQSGTSVDSLQAGLKTMTAAMDGVASGSKKNIEQFERLGVAVQNNDGTFRSQEDVFFDVVTALQNMDDQTEKARLATELFGRSGSELMPLLNGAAGSMDEMRQKAHDLGLVMSDEAIDSGVKLTDTIDQVKRSFSAITNEIGVQVMPIVQQALDFILDNMPTVREVMSDVFDVISTVVTTAVSVFSNLYSYVSENVVPVLSEVWADKVQPAISAGFEAIKGLWENTLKPALEAIWTFVTDTLVPKLQEAWPKVQWAVEQVFIKIKDIWENTLKPAFSAIWEFVTETLLPKFEEAWPVIQEAVTVVFDGIKTAWETVLAPAFDSIKAGVGFVLSKFNVVWPKIQNAVTTVFTAIDDAWTNGLAVVFAGIKNILDTVKNKFTEVWDGVKEKVTGVFDTIKTAWEGEGGLKSAFNSIKKVIEKLKNTFETVWTKEGGIGQILHDSWTSIKHAWTDTFKPVWDKITKVIEGLKTTFSETWENIKTTVSEVWEGIKTAYDDSLGKVFSSINEAIEGVIGAFGSLTDKVHDVFDWFKEGSVYDIINSGLSFVKDLFNFEWSLPKPKLPSFHWDWMDIGGLLSIPRFWIEWNRKAYENPFLFSKPTIMGGYGFGDGNGGEIVYGHDNLMRDIREAMGDAGRSLSVVINVTQNPDESQEELATRISEIISQQYDRREAVFA